MTNAVGKSEPVEVVHSMARGSNDVELMNLIDAIPFAADADSEEIEAQLLAATSIEDIVTAGELPSSKDLGGKVVTVESVGKRESTKGEQGDVYLIMTGFTGAHRTPFTWSTGSRKIMIKMGLFHRLGAFPVRGTITLGQSAAGRDFGDFIPTHVKGKAVGKSAE